MKSAHVFQQACLLRHVMTFLGDNNYVFLAGVASGWREVLLGASPVITTPPAAAAAAAPAAFSSSAATSPSPLTKTSISAAVASVSRLLWAMDAGLVPERATRAAARHAEIEVIQGMISAGHLVPNAERSGGGGRGFSDWAAGAGRLEVLQWGKRQGFRFSKWSCADAAAGGHLDVLRWLRGEECGCEWGEETTWMAAMNGHLAVVQWARANGCQWSEQASWCAAANGHLHVLQYLRANNCPWDAWTPIISAENGHMNVLNWAILNGAPVDVQVCQMAARRGDLRMLRWARDHGCPWSELTMAAAAENGHLDVLIWLRRHGCPVDEYAAANAASHGHLEVLQWVVANGFPWDKECCSRARKWAKRGGDRRLLAWIHANNSPCGHRPGHEEESGEL